jgi:hypothetical protein
MVNVASSATSSGGRWFVGSLTHTLPPIVPRFRTWTSAIVPATSARIGPCDVDLGRALQLGARDHRADLEHPVRREPDPAQLVEIGKVDEHVGRGRALLHHVDQRLAPGERAAPSWAASIETASSTVAGRAYSTSRRSMSRFSHTAS